MDPVSAAVSSVVISSADPRSSHDSTPLERRLRGIDPKRIVFIGDLDMTLVKKPANNFHYLTLDPDEHKTLRRAAKEFALCVVLTARGEVSTLDVLFQQHGVIDNMVIASNCGHHVLTNSSLAKSSERLHHPIGAMNHEESIVLRDAIYGLLNTIASDYVINSGRLIIDPRELCGAIIWEAMDLEDAKRLTKLAQHEKGLLPENIKPLLHYDSKYIEIDGRHFGYMDFKPYGMDKGSSLHALFNLEVIAARLPKDPVFIVAGDSMPDYAMMQAAVERFGPDSVINIRVGDDPNLAATQDIEIHHVPGDQYLSVPAFYRLLEQAAKPVLRKA